MSWPARHWRNSRAGDVRIEPNNVSRESRYLQPLSAGPGRRPRAARHRVHAARGHAVLLPQRVREIPVGRLFDHADPVAAVHGSHHLCLRALDAPPCLGSGAVEPARPPTLALRSHDRRHGQLLHRAAVRGVADGRIHQLHVAPDGGPPCDPASGRACGTASVARCIDGVRRRSRHCPAGFRCHTPGGVAGVLDGVLLRALSGSDAEGRAVRFVGDQHHLYGAARVRRNQHRRALRLRAAARLGGSSRVLRSRVLRRTRPFLPRQSL